MQFGQIYSLSILEGKEKSETHKFNADYGDATRKVLS